MPFEIYLNDTAPWLLAPYYKQALWAWLALPVAFVSAFFISIILIRLLNFVVTFMIRCRKDIYFRYIEPLQAPIQMWLGIVLFAISTHLLPLSKATQNGLKYVVGSIAIYAIIWGMFRIVTNTSNFLRERFLSKGKVSAASLIPLMRKLLKAFLAAMALLFLLQNWGFDVAALLAGLGIGGIAIALASQKSVENLFGGVSVTLDQPVRIGDTITFNNKTGIVEDIGLRSTTVRTGARTLITIPNSQFSEMQLENLSSREKMQIVQRISLSQDTSPEQIRAITSRITEYIASRDDTEKGAKARLVNFGASSFDIDIAVYILTIDGNVFMDAQEDIFLKIIDIVHEEGAKLAPSSTVYVEREVTADKIKKKMHLAS